MKKLQLLSLIGVVSLFLACGDEQGASQKQNQQQQMPPLPVEAMRVKVETLNFNKSYSAILKPSQEVEVIARVSGVLEKENFKEGAFVEQESTLYEIQKNEYEASLDEAKANLLKAEANFNKASKDWSRLEYLYANKAISEQQKDEALFVYENANAELQRAKAALKNAQIEYDYTSIKAPISGVVGLSLSDVGSYIAANNAKLTTITSLDPIYAEFSLPNSDVIKYRASIQIDANVTLQMGAKHFSGVVDYVSSKLDSKTETLLVRAKIPNPNYELTIGSYVTLQLSGFSYDNVIKIPQKALLKTPDATMVYVIEEGVAKMRPVSVGHTDDAMAIIHGGLFEGESVIISNIAKVRPNAKVSIISGE